MAQDRVVLLDDNTANRIAAGEVVERPASAVKELVENSIDAGATQITVTLEEGGKQRLTISDNGYGMTRSDAVLALHRHATSKIRSADDLFAIKTLGFRGEALPSIASVSQFVLTTKPADEEAGTRLVVHGGDVVEVQDVAARDGTTVEVAELFFNTPARRKFLKSTPTEVSRAVEVVGHLAAAYPHVAIRLKSGDHEIFATPGTGEALATLAAVWGRDIARKLIPIRSESPGLTVTGYMATPDISRPGRSHELFFVNRRPIKSRLLAHALEEAVRSLTPDSRYPIGCVFVEITPDMVDVNVHPTKTEVKFTRDGEVHHAVSQAVKSALLAYGIVPTARVSTGLPVASSAQPIPSNVQPSLDMLSIGRTAISSTGYSFSTGSFPSFDARVLAAIESFSPIEGVRPEPAINLLPSHSDSPDDELNNPPTPALTSNSQKEAGADEILEPARPRPFAEQLREFKVIGQARNTYIIALTPDGIAVIDQHVAHERVLYERLTVKRFSNGIPVQRLAVPITLNLSRREALLLGEHTASFAASGWEIAPFGGESFVVHSIPAMLNHKPYEKILRDMVDELVNQSVSRRLLVQQEHVTITNACKMAVKAGDPLNIEEMTGLLEQLAETENPYLCPHGRPIVVTVSFHELDKQFKRA